MRIAERRKRLGCNKAPEDLRDFVLRAPKWRPELPDYLDHSDGMLPVQNQGYEPTCVGFATSAMKEWQERKELKGKNIDLSARFIYEEARKIDGIPDEQGGTNVRSAMKILHKVGICTEDLWPYRGKARESSHSEAARYKIASYGTIPTIMDKKDALCTNGPFVVGVRIFEDWYKAEVDETGVIPEPKGDPEGGHAICVVGYNNENGRFKFRNSWGKKWGDDGYGYISYDYMDEHSWDAWTSVDITIPYIPVKKKELEEKETLKEIIREMMRDFLVEQELMSAPTSDTSTTEIIIRVGPAEEV